MRAERVAGAVAVLIGGSALLVAGCGDGGPGAADGRGAGVEALELLDLRAEPLADGFRQVGGIARDGEGRTYVVDAGAHEIRVLDAGGAPLFSFGERGEGDGRLGEPCCPAVGPEGLLWVRDRVNARYQAFEVGEEGAEAVRAFPIRHSAPGLWAPTTFDDLGRLVDVGLAVDPETRETRPVRVHVNPATGAVEGVARLPQPTPERMGRAGVTGMREGKESTFYLYQPHGPRSLLAHGPGGWWAEAVSDTYAVRVAGPDGMVREIVGPGGQGPPLTETERAEARETLAGYRERFGVEEGEIPFGVPDRKPVLRALHFDREGRLWVEVSTAGPRREAHVYTTDGTPVARYAWPGDVWLDVRAWVGREEALGVRIDTAAAAGSGGAAGTGEAGQAVVRLVLPEPGGP